MSREEPGIHWKVAAFHHRSFGKRYPTATTLTLEFTTSFQPCIARPITFGARNTNGLTYLLEIGDTALLVRESGEEIFQQHIYRFCCKCIDFIAPPFTFGLLSSRVVSHIGCSLDYKGYQSHENEIIWREITNIVKNIVYLPANVQMHIQKL